MALVFFDDFEGSAGSIAGRTVDGLTWENGYGNDGTLESESYSTPPMLDGSGHLRSATDNWDSACRLALPSSFFGGAKLTLEVAVFAETTIPGNQMAIRFANTGYNQPTYPCLVFNYTGGSYRLYTGGGDGTYTPLGLASHKFKLELDFVGGLMKVYDQTSLVYSISLPTPEPWLTISIKRSGVNSTVTLESVKMYTDDNEDPPEPPSPSAFWTDFIASREIP